MKKELFLSLLALLSIGTVSCKKENIVAYSGVVGKSYIYYRSNPSPRDTFFGYKLVFRSNNEVDQFSIDAQGRIFSFEGSHSYRIAGDRIYYDGSSSGYRYGGHYVEFKEDYFYELEK